MVVGGLRAVVRALPSAWRKGLDDRIFGAIFQVTRVTNDAYGWKAPPADTAGRAAEPAPPPDPATPP